MEALIGPVVMVMVFCALIVSFFYRNRRIEELFGQLAEHHDGVYVPQTRHIFQNTSYVQIPTEHGDIFVDIKPKESIDKNQVPGR